MDSELSFLVEQSQDSESSLSCDNGKEDHEKYTAGEKYTARRHHNRIQEQTAKSMFEKNLETIQSC